MGVERLHDGAFPGRGKANPDARPDPPMNPDAPWLALRFTDTSLSHVVVAALLLTVAGAPFLKGILAGFALAGAAATVRNMLGV